MCQCIVCDSKQIIHHVKETVIKLISTAAAAFKSFEDGGRQISGQYAHTPEIISQFTSKTDWLLSSAAQSGLHFHFSLRKQMLKVPSPFAGWITHTADVQQCCALTAGEGSEANSCSRPHQPQPGTAGYASPTPSCYRPSTGAPKYTSHQHSNILQQQSNKKEVINKSQCKNKLLRKSNVHKLKMVMTGQCWKFSNHAGSAGGCLHCQRPAILADYHPKETLQLLSHSVVVQQCLFWFNTCRIQPTTRPVDDSVDYIMEPDWVNVLGREAMRIKIINGLLNQPREDAWKPNTRPPKGQPGKDSPSNSNRQLAKQTVPHTGYWCLKQQIWVFCFRQLGNN